MDKRITTALVLTAFVGAGFAAVAAAQSASAASGPTVAFGIDAGGVNSLTNLGAKPDLATMWIGPWTLTSGWGGPDGQLASMASSGVTPAIHFYYWGDDITPSCVENGCWSSLHNAQKDRAHWNQLADQLAAHLQSKLGGKQAVVFVESEFNKGGISTYEPFDGYMADMMARLHAGYPAAKLVLAYGNWDQGNWGNFDRAAAAADWTGLQGMRGSTKDSLSSYQSLYTATLAGAQKLHTLFAKPVMLTDIALSSYPEPAYVGYQATELQKFFDGMPALQAAGVTAMVYRSWTDSPNMDLANYYGEAERHWGLAYASSGAQKSAGQVWLQGVGAVRAATTNAAPTAAFTATATDRVASVDAAGSNDANGDALTYAWAWGDGATATGAKATHTYATAGTYTVSLTVSDGQATGTATHTVTATQENRAPLAVAKATASGLAVAVDGTGSSDADGDALTYAWSFGDGASATTATATHTYAASGTYTVTLRVSDGKATAQQAVSAAVTAPAPVPLPAPTPTTTSYTPTFSVPSGANEWWVEVRVSDPSASKVEVNAGSGWVTLAKTSWGSYAKSIHVAKGTPVTFRATSATGGVGTSATVAWLAASTVTLSTASATGATSTTTSAFTATFSPKAVGNDWWVEIAVSGNQAVSKVEARLNGGAWQSLPKDSWGTYAKSMAAPNGSKVEFRATATTGATAQSTVVTWA